MKYKTATNKKTGDKVYWDGYTWNPVKTATNKKTGDKVYWDGEAWEPLEVKATPEPSESPGVVSSAISGAGKGLARTAGVVVGAANVPSAFIWGSQTPEFQEEYNKLPEWKKPFVATMGGIKSAYKSLTEKGSFGTTYGDYYKRITGESIHDSVAKKTSPKTADYVAPALEMLAEIVSDPTITLTGAASVIRNLRIPTSAVKLTKMKRGIKDLAKGTQDVKEWQLSGRKIIEAMEGHHGIDAAQTVKTLSKIEGLEKSEKEAVQIELLKVLKSRLQSAQPEVYKSAKESAEVFDKALIESRIPGNLRAKLKAEETIAKAKTVREEMLPREMPVKEPDFLEKATARLGGKVGGPIEQRSGARLIPEEIAGTRRDIDLPVIGKTGKLEAPLGERKTPYEFGEKGQMVRFADEEAKYAKEAEEFRKAADVVEKEPHVKGVTTMGGAIRAMGKINFGKMKEDAQIPEAALGIKYISKKSGVPYDIAERELKEQGWLKPDEDLIMAVREPGFLQRKNLHRDIKIADEFVEEPPSGAREIKRFDDLEKGKKLTIIENQSEKGWGQYEVGEITGAGTEIKNIHTGEKLVIDPFSEVEVLTRELKTGKLTKLHAASGAALGIRQDEEGNVYFDPKIAALGMSGVASFMYLKGGKFKKLLPKKNQDLLANNPNLAKIDAQIGEHKTDPWYHGIISTFMKTGVDRFNTLRKIDSDTYKAARTFQSHRDNAYLGFTELDSYLKPVRGEGYLFSRYLTAHRDLSRLNQGIKSGEGITVKVAKDAIEEINNIYKAKGKDPAELKSALKSFQKWTHDEILRPAYESGFISKDRYDEIKHKNKWYATFDVLKYHPNNVNDLPVLKSKEYFSKSNQDIIKKMVGTKEQIADPIEATLRKFGKAKSDFEKNRVASILVDSDIARSIGKRVAMSKKEYRKLKRTGWEVEHVGRWDVNEWSTVNRFKDGRVERYIFPKDIGDAMKEMTPWQAPRILKGFAPIFRRTVTTLNPAFWISNMQRDALMAYTISPVYKWYDFPKFVTDWGKGFREGIKHEFGGGSDLVEEYIKNRGSFGFFGMHKKPKKLKKDLFEGQMARVIKGANPLKVIEDVNSAIELAPRLAVMERAKKLGKTPEEGAWLARNATIDFNQAGIHTKILNQFTPFLTSNINARTQFARALATDSKSTAAKVFASTIGPGLAAYAFNRWFYSDEYDKIPREIKENYFTLIYGTGKDKDGKMAPKYFVIAKGDTGEMFFNPIEYMLEKYYEKDPDSVMKVAATWLSDLSPVPLAKDGKIAPLRFVGGLMPPGFKQAGEVLVNKNTYWGTDIVNPWALKNIPPELQYRESTPMVYKELGNALKISPEKLRHLASGVLGPYGRTGGSPIGMLNNAKGRIAKTKGGGVEHKAIVAIDDIKQGYNYARAYAQKAVKEGDSKLAIKLMLKWNAGVNKQIVEYNKRFKKYGLHDRGGVKRKYTFTKQKIRYVIGKRDSELTYLERQLTGRN